MLVSDEGAAERWPWSHTPICVSLSSCSHSGADRPQPMADLATGKYCHLGLGSSAVILASSPR